MAATKDPPCPDDTTLMAESEEELKNLLITMPDKGPYSHGYGLPEVIYGCESWTVKKAER